MDEKNHSEPRPEVDENDRESSTDGRTETRALVTQRPYDPADRHDLATVIVDAIAEAEGVSITEVRSPPLYEQADIESIEKALFGRTKASTNSTVTFLYADYEVHVEADGWVSVWQTKHDESNPD